MLSYSLLSGAAVLNGGPTERAELLHLAGTPRYAIDILARQGICDTANNAALKIDRFYQHELELAAAAGVNPAAPYILIYDNHNPKWVRKYLIVRKRSSAKILCGNRA